MRSLVVVLILLAVCTLSVAEEDADRQAAVRERISRLAGVDAGGRFSAAVELGKMADPAAVKPLVAVLQNDDDYFVRRAAARALGAIGDAGAVPGLVDALTDAEIYVGLQAARSLRAITGSRHGFGPELSAEERVAAQKRWRDWWASHPKAKVRAEVETKPVVPAPPRVKPTADPAVFVKNLSSEDAGVRFAAAVELGRLGLAEAARPLCERLAKDPDLFVRRACARALGQIGKRSAVPALIDALTDKEIFVALEAAKSLRKITHRAPGLNAQRDDSGRVQQWDTPEERQAMQARYRTWWKETGSKQAAGEDGAKTDNEKDR